jgi:hypothetical protein
MSQAPPVITPVHIQRAKAALHGAGIPAVVAPNPKDNPLLKRVSVSRTPGKDELEAFREFVTFHQQTCEKGTSD